MDHHVVVLGVVEIGQGTWRIVLERPIGYEVHAGQAADLAIDEAGWWDKPRPFHFRRVEADDTLEFVIRLNGDDDPVVRRMARLQKGDNVVVSQPLDEDIPNVFFGGWRRPQPVASVEPRKFRVA